MCPGKVEIVGVAPEIAGVYVHTGADGTEVRGVAIRGPKIGLALTGSQNVVVDRAWIHETGERGLNVQRTLGPTSLVVTDTLIEDAARALLSNFGAQVTLGSSRLRCGSFALEGEDSHGEPFAFEDLGDVLCGCPEATDPCVAVSAGLPPPKPVESLPEG